MDDHWDADDDEPQRRLVMERFRRLGWLAVVMVPLLVITLAQTVVSRRWAIIVFIGGLVALTAFRERSGPD